MFDMRAALVGACVAVAAIGLWSGHLLEAGLALLPFAAGAGVVVGRRTRDARARDGVEALLDALPDGALALDADGRVRHANQAAAIALGRSAEALRGRTADAILAGAGTTPSPPHRTRLKGLDERERDLELEARPGLLLVRDVSARRCLEERLAHALRLETVGRLAGSVAHDFNNLLTVIGANAVALAECRPEDVPEIAGEMLDVQHRGTNLTRQLLTFARRDTPRPVDLDLAETLRGLSRMLGRLVGEQHRLHTTVEGSAMIRADRGQMEQVLINLVTNARDASPRGPIELSLRVVPAASARALGSPLDAASQAVLAVTDSGAGMDAETRERIFEPFFTTKAPGQGTGLGLATVREVVTTSGGAVHVESEPGRGSTFRVFLPATDEAGSPTPEYRTVGPRGQGESVLLVEDDRYVRRVARRILERGGYRVTAASDAESALAASETLARVDLLLTDIALPGASGVELGVRLGALRPGLRTLYMTGYLDRATVGDVALDPDTNLIPKPFEPNELLGRVHAALKG